MKVTVKQGNLRKALTVAEKIVGKSSSLPILGNILFKTENGRLKVSATNLEMGVNCFIGAKVDEVGEITVPARIVSDLVSGLQDEKVTLTTKNNNLFIQSEAHKTQIFGFSAGDFPIIPKIKSEQAYVIASHLFKGALQDVIDSASLSETTPELSGIFVVFNQDTITLAATDSSRLAERTIPQKNAKTTSCIIPRATAAELIRILGELESEISITLTSNQICFSTEDFELISRLIEGNYPDYKKVIPEKTTSQVIVSREELEKNIRLAGLFSSTISDIKLICYENKIDILGKNQSKGEITIVMEAPLKGDPFDISLNFRYLLDGLKVMPGDKVQIGFTGQTSPLIIRPEGKEKQVTYIVMPLRNS